MRQYLLASMLAHMWHPLGKRAFSQSLILKVNKMEFICKENKEKTKERSNKKLKSSWHRSLNMKTTKIKEQQTKLILFLVFILYPYFLILVNFKYPSNYRGN